MPGLSPRAIAIQTQARSMFTRVLSGWASDLLRLRRSGLADPGHRPGKQDVVTPAFDGPQDEPRWASDVAGALRWRPAA